MRGVLADLRYACRVMSRTPSFAMAVVGVLALGIGANTAMFSIVNAVLLRPMPFENSERLVRVFTRTAPTALAGPAPFAVSAGKFYDWQRSAQSFDGMALVRSRTFAMTGRGTARTVSATAVSTGFFDVLRARPALGRVFVPEEDAQGRHRVVIVSDGFWSSELGRSADILDQPLRLNGETYTIVGVMPASVSNTAWNVLSPDVWVPLALNEKERAVRMNHNLRVIARLKPQVGSSRRGSAANSPIPTAAGARSS
jgi:putative ABC transport system permease protein